MSEWYVHAIISYQAIHNNFSLKTINHDVELNKMIDYLESKTLSMDSKKVVAKNFWKKKRLNEIRIIYLAVKASEKEGNIFDIRNLSKRGLKNIDLLTYSFPCQDLSQQGKQEGITQKSTSRSGLLWEIGKALDVTAFEDLPQYLLLENVVAFTYKKNVVEFAKWINKLESLGYTNNTQILNAAEFGSPQARKRVFIISSLNPKFNFSIKNSKNSKVINDILNDEPCLKDFMPALDKYDLTDFKKTKSNIKKAALIDYSAFNSETYVYDPEYKGPTLTASGANSRIKVQYKNKIRKLNAREAYRYMGFEETDYKKVNNLNYLKENKMIFTCGNSISLEVLEKITNNIYKDYKC